MKKIFSMVLTLCMLSCIFTGISFATGDEDITEKFKDPFFLEEVLLAADKNGDGRITRAEAEAVKALEITNYEIVSISGLEYFMNLEALSIYVYLGYTGNQTLNVSHMKNLTYLDCSWVGLSGLNVSGCTKLETLYAGGNSIQNLDISGNLALKYLDVSGTRISSLDLSAHLELRELYCMDSYYLTSTSLTLPKSGKLETLDFSWSNFRTIDLTGQSGLKNLYLYATPIISIDFSDSPKIENLDISGTRIVDLDLSLLKNLKQLACGGGDYLRKIDVSRNTELTYLGIFDSVIESVDVSKNPKLEYLIVAYSGVKELDISKNPELIVLYCNGLPLTSLDVSKNPKLEHLSVSNSNLKELDVSKNLKLISINCNDTQITSIDLTQNTELIEASFWNANLSSIDLSKNTKLEYIDMDGNPNLTELILPATDSVRVLYCAGTSLTSLDVSAFKNLWGVSCSETQIERLDLSANNNLAWIDCANSEITELILPDPAPNLTELICVGNNLTSITDVLGTKSMDLYWFIYYPQKVEQNEGWNRFSDISSDSWYYEDIKFMVVNGFVPSSLSMDFALESQSYGPQELVTRGQLVESLYAAAISINPDNYDYWWYCPFDDVSWEQYSAVAWAAEFGIVKGVDERHFNPDAPITRQDLATILVRFVQHMEITLPEGSAVTFSDESAIASYAADYVKTLSNSGIIKGMDDGRFAPRDNVTRAQIAALLHRLLTL